MPAYNAEKWIGQTLASIRSQTFSDFEIIIVIDGATDGTLEIARQFADLDPRAKVIETPNGGVARARNAGIAIARGEFIAPVDADDLWHPTRLEQHVEALRSLGDDYAVAYSPYLAIDANNITTELPWIHRTDGYVFGTLLVGNVVGNGSALTVRAEALRAVGGYTPELRDQDGEGCEDYLVQLRLAYHYKFICVPRPLIGYRKFPGNMSSNHMRMRRSGFLMLEDIERYATGLPKSALYHPRAKAIINLAVRYIRDRQVSTGLGIWAREFFRNPLVLPHTVMAGWDRLRAPFLRRWRRYFPPKKVAKVPYDTIDPNTIVFDPYPFFTRTFMSFYDRQMARHIRSQSHGDDK